MALTGVVVAACAVMLYATSNVMQAVAARRLAARSGRAPGLKGLVLEPVWLGAVAILGMAFLTFVASTRLLPLPTAEAIRASSPVFAVLLSHAVFHTRPRRDEIAGVLIALGGLSMFVGSGGERGTGEPDAGTALLMGLVLVLVVISAVLLERVPLRRSTIGVLNAILGGVAFVVLDMGARSLPESLTVTGVIGMPALWIGGVGALVGLVMYARATSRTSIAVASTSMIMFSVVLATVWSAWTFGDSVSAEPLLLVAALVAMAGGTGLVMRSATTPESSVV